MEIKKDIEVNISSSISLKYDERYNILFKKYYDTLNDIKKNINNNTKEWDKIKKYINPYELLHISYLKKKNNSIAKYIPVSRSYFKMIELINDYKLLDDVKTKDIVVGCLAEGPGGFMEAINNYRKSVINNDIIYGITLEPENSEIPEWKKVNNNFRVCYGNIYVLKDILNFSNNFNKEKAYLITADGGFDFSTDFFNQEKLSYRIILCEIITTLGIQKIGGNFVCKIFDIFNVFTIKMLYIIYCFYENVYITKPKTSRIANSEKYIVAKGFRGITQYQLNIFYNIIDSWDEKNNKLINDIDGIVLNNQFIHEISKYNEDYVQIQIKYMNDILYYIQNGISNDIYNEITKNQVENAIEWCHRYNVKINKKSSFLNYNSY